MEQLSMILISKRDQDMLTEQQKSLVSNLFGENSLRNRSTVEEVRALKNNSTD